MRISFRARLFRPPGDVTTAAPARQRVDAALAGRVRSPRCLFGSSRWRRRCSRAGGGTSRAGSRRRGSSSRGPRARGSRTSTAAATSTSPAGSAARTSATAIRAVVAAIHEQVDRYLHQCFMVGSYEPYVEVCRRLAELSPCRASEQRSLLLNSGAEAVENAVKIARAATGRPAVVVFDHGFHGRTLLTMTMTAKVDRTSTASARSRPRSTARRRRTRTAASRATTRSPGSQRLFKGEVDPESVACAVLEPVQGEGGFVPMPPDFPARAARALLASTGSSTSTTRCSRASAAPARSGRSSTTASSPTCSSPGKSLGGGLPLARVTGRRRGDGRGRARRARRHVRRQPGRVRGGERRPRHGREPGFRARAEAIGAGLRAAPRRDRRPSPRIGEVRGLGPMLALELAEQEPGARAGASRRPRRGGPRRCSRAACTATCIRILVPLSSATTTSSAGSSSGGGAWRRRCERTAEPSRRLRRSTSARRRAQDLRRRRRGRRRRHPRRRAASSSRCSARRARARRRRCG